MKAIILAAGYGRRMRPLTDDTHKTMLKIGDTTIIERILDGLIENAVTDVTLVTGYLADELVGFVTAHYPNVALSVVHNPDYDTTNNIYSMALAFDQIEIDQDVLLIESDLIFSPAVLTGLINDERDTVALVDHYHQGMDGTVVTVGDGVITNVIPPHLQDSNFDFSDKFKTLNIYKLAQEFASTEFRQLLTYYAKVIDDNVYYELILGIMIYMGRCKVHALVVDQADLWAEVDDPNDLDNALFVFGDHRQREMLEGSFGGYWNFDVVDFCFIRNMYFPTGSVLSELRNNMASLLWNYGSKQSIIDRKMGYYLKCNQDHVITLNGAAQAFPILRQLYGSRPGIIPNPTFGEYYALFDNFSFYEEAAIGTDTLIGADDEVIVFVNPNNPTGTEVDSGYILELATQHPEKLFIIDESFIEFSRYESVIDRLEETPVDNIVVLKSLSKSLGIPGMRLGYLYTTSAEIMAQIRAEIPVWNINSVAEHFLEIVLKHRDVIDESFAQTNRDRAELSAELDRCPCVTRVLPSGGNFITCEMNMTRDELVALQEELLETDRLFIKNASSKFNGAGAYMRVAVRTPADNELLVKALRAVS